LNQTTKLKNVYRHIEGDEVAIEIAGPLVQFLDQNGLRDYFCFQDLCKEPNREFGIMHLYEIVDSLPKVYKPEARSIVDRHLETGLCAA
jgi:hypothetical protein